MRVITTSKEETENLKKKKKETEKRFAERRD